MSGTDDPSSKPSASTNATMGRRLRELRDERGLKQAELARRLQISPAYLSLIEQGKRPMQLPLLFVALGLLDVSMEEFAQSIEASPLPSPLSEWADDPLFRSLGLAEADVSAIARTPETAQAFADLFRLYRGTQSQLDALLNDLADEETRGERLRFDVSPLEEVTEFLEAARNFFPTLEKRAAEFRRKAKLRDDVRATSLELALKSQLGVTVENVSEAGVIQRWNRAGRTLRVSQRVPEPRRRFQLARAVALRLFDEEGLHEPLLKVGPSRPDTQALIKLHLANYFAGALLLPYERFIDDVEATRYDVELLAERFDISYETVAHRICNLRDPSRPGIPMHFARVDVAGNISKRYAGDGIPFPKRGGGCPRMAAHLAFVSPNILTKQYVVFPDGRTYFTFAKVVGQPQGGSVARGTLYSIGLGCRAEDAGQLSYADDMPFVDPKRMAVPVGPTCRFCDRRDCKMRSTPSYKLGFRVEQDVTKGNFFAPPAEDREP